MNFAFDGSLILNAICCPAGEGPKSGFDVFTETVFVIIPPIHFFSFPLFEKYDNALKS